jgi:hypothetical protein
MTEPQTIEQTPAIEDYASRPKRPRKVVGSRARRGRPGRKLGGKNKPGHHAGRPRKHPVEVFHPSIWTSGRAEVSVEQKHLDAALRANSSHCAIAMAIADAVPNARRTSVDLQTIRWTDCKRNVRYCFLTPHVAQQDIIIPFDQGETCKPVTFKMRPAWVIKAGARYERQAPDPEQLRGTGLKPAADPSPERPLIPYAGKEKPERKRRTMISATKPDGSIPVTLGGKLPPRSVLARREYGMRVLKK